MSRDSPFDGVERFFERMARGFADPLRPWGWPVVDAMPVDLVENADEYVVTADLPGIEDENVDVWLDGRTLHIEASITGQPTGGEYRRHERRRSSPRRELRLPGEVNPGAVTARMHNGVLTVTLPKSAGRKTIRVDREE